MEKGNIVKFAPELLGAIKETMGRLPSILGDLAKIKALTILNKHDFKGEPGMVFMHWMEFAPGNFSAVGAMENLHTLQFKNDRVLHVEEFTFLSKLKKLKKLDLSGTDFSDCRLLRELPALQHAVLPDRRRLIHTEVLWELSARVEPKPEKEERERCHGLYETDAVPDVLLSEDFLAEDFFTGNSYAEDSYTGNSYTADARLICWIAASLGKLPDTPSELGKVKQLDGLDTKGTLDKWALQDARSKKISDVGETFGNGKLPLWLSEKEGDFSLLAKLPNLRKLFLWGTDLKDFSFLSDCKQLSYVNLWDTDFSDCRILVDLPRLQCVCLPEKGKLKNFSVLKERQAAEAAKIKEKAREDMYGGGKADASLSVKRPLLIKIEPELVVLEDSKDKGKRYYKAVKPWDGEGGKLWKEKGGELREEKIGKQQGKKVGELQEEKAVKRQEGGLAAGNIGVKSENDVPTERYAVGRKEKISPADETGKNRGATGGEETPFFRDDEFDQLAVVRGEDVTISYQGSSKVRHVCGRFWMEAKLSPMWNKFLEMEEEEDNWAQFSLEQARTMTDELVCAVARGDVADLFLSLDSYGEGAYLTLEFAQGWAAINYMDDEDAVYYSIYNPLYPKASELCPVEVGGQSPVPKMLAVEDLGLAAEIVQYFLEKGQLLPGTVWKTNQDEICLEDK